MESLVTEDNSRVTQLVVVACAKGTTTPLFALESDHCSHLRCHCVLIWVAPQAQLVFTHSVQNTYDARYNSWLLQSASFALFEQAEILCHNIEYLCYMDRHHCSGQCAWMRANESDAADSANSANGVDRAGGCDGDNGGTRGDGNASTAVTSVGVLPPTLTTATVAVGASSPQHLHPPPSATLVPTQVVV